MDPMDPMTWGLPPGGPPPGFEVEVVKLTVTELLAFDSILALLWLTDVVIRPMGICKGFWWGELDTTTEPCWLCAGVTVTAVYTGKPCFKEIVF